MAADWTEIEVQIIVHDYFNMLRAELSGEHYVKSKHRKHLITLLNNRSEGSIEFKHQNISAVLIEMGIPYIDGYKPRYNYQRSVLPNIVAEYLIEHSDLFSLFRRDADFSPPVPSAFNYDFTVELPPQSENKKVFTSKNEIAEPNIPYRVSSVDYLEIEGKNALLGSAGEQFVLNYERERLIRSGHESMANKIEQVSETIGPTAGYDIRSYEESGQERFIEVKTTKYGKNTPFFITPNELSFAETNSANYFIYRVFKFRDIPKIFLLNGSPSKHCRIKPSLFQATPGRL